MKQYVCALLAAVILMCSLSMLGCTSTGVSVVTGKGVDRGNTSPICSESESNPSTGELADTSADDSETAKSDKPPVQSSAPLTTKVPSTTKIPETTKSPTLSEKEITVIVNTSSKVFHVDPNCTHVKRMKTENKSVITATPSSLAALGYKPCGSCSKSYK